MGLTALMLLQHARAAARFDAEGGIVLLDDQDRSAVGRQADRRGPGADRQGDAASASRALPGAGGDRRAACARQAGRGHRLGADRPALRALERLQPSPVVTLNRAVAVSKVRGPAAALAMIEPLARRAARLFLLLRRQGRPAAAARPRATRRASPSTRRSRWPTRRPRPRISASTSIISTKKALSLAGPQASRPASCHVWTAPVSQGIDSIFWRRSRSGHVSGLFVRPIMCRWPRWYTCRVSNHPDALWRAMTTRSVPGPVCLPISPSVAAVLLAKGLGASADGWRAIGLVVREHGPQDAGGAGGLGDGDDLPGPARHHAAQPGRGLSRGGP